MSLTLAETITETTREFSVTGTVPDEIAPGYEFRLDDELLTLRDFGAGSITTPIEDRRFVGRDRNFWIVTRGENAASHAQHTVVYGATDAFTSSGTADIPDPFQITDGVVTTSSPLTGPTLHDELVALASGDNPPGLFAVLAVSNDTGGVGIISDATGSDTADASTTATSVDGNATATTTATATGDGSADAGATASVLGAGTATVVMEAATAGAIKDAMLNLTADASSATMAASATDGVTIESSAGAVVITGSTDFSVTLPGGGSITLTNGTTSLRVTDETIGDTSDIFKIEQGEYKIATNGDLFIADNNTDGAQGKLLTAAEGPSGEYGAHAEWLSICTVVHSTPVGGGFVTPLMFDDTASTGGLYAFIGTDYVKIGLATS